MLYRFAAFFYKTIRAPARRPAMGRTCPTATSGARLLYPAGPGAVAAMAEQSAQGLELIGADEAGTERPADVDRLVELDVRTGRDARLN